MHPGRRTVLSCLPLACGAWAWPAPGAAQSGHTLSPWPAGQAMAPFALTDLQGKTWRLRELRGRAVLLNFWASWCPPCRAEMPSLQQLADLHGANELCVLAINFKESAATAARFAQASGLTLPIVLDPQGATARHWGVRIFPTTVLIAASGQPRFRLRGEFDWSGQEAARLMTTLLSG